MLVNWVSALIYGLDACYSDSYVLYENLCMVHGVLLTDAGRKCGRLFGDIQKEANRKDDKLMTLRKKFGSENL